MSRPRWFLVAALVAVASSCHGGSSSLTGAVVADGIKVVRGSSLVVPAVRSPEPEPEQAAGWQAVVSAGDDPLDVVDGYARQLLDQGFDLRNVGPAACVNRWNRGQSTTQESALGHPLPAGATSIGVTCHVAGRRGGRAISLYLTSAWSTGEWVLLLRRMPAEMLGLARLGGAYRTPKGELPRVEAHRGDAGVVLGSIGRPVPVLAGDRRVLDGVAIDQPWFCTDPLVGVIRTEVEPQPAIDRYVRALVADDVFTVTSSDDGPEPWVLGHGGAGGPTYELHAVRQGDHTMVLVEGCPG